MEIAVQTMGGWDQSIALARWAEDEGLAAFAVADHYLAGPDRERPAWEQLVMLGALARETSVIRLATLVSPISFRHPAVMYKAAVTLDELSGGRFSLGVGAGWMQEEHDAYGLELWDTSERFDRLEDALGYLRTAIDGDGTGHDGAYYRLEPFVAAPAPRGLGIVVGGSGRSRTPRLAGRFADEFNVVPDGRGTVRARVALARRAAEEAGRDPDALLVSTAFPPVVADDDADLGRRIREMAGRRGRDPAELRRRLEQTGIPFGTRRMVTEGLARLAAAGVRRVYLQVSFVPLEEIRRTVGIVKDAIAEV